MKRVTYWPQAVLGMFLPLRFTYFLLGIDAFLGRQIRSRIQLGGAPRLVRSGRRRPLACGRTAVCGWRALDARVR
jgi:hypothetical protein